MKLNINKSRSILASAALLALGSGNVAQAATANSTQLYSCSSGTSSIFFQQVTGQNKQFGYGTSNRVAAITPNAAGGTLGVILTPPSATFSNIYWYVAPVNGTSALPNLNVYLCFNNPNGTFFSSVYVPNSATVVVSAGQGWYLVRPSLPSNTVGKVLTQATFQYNGSTTQKIYLGKVVLNGNSIGSVLNTALLGCQAESCP